MLTKGGKEGVTHGGDLHIERVKGPHRGGGYKLKGLHRDGRYTERRYTRRKVYTEVVIHIRVYTRRIYIQKLG